MAGPGALVLAWLFNLPADTINDVLFPRTPPHHLKQSEGVSGSCLSLPPGLLAFYSRH